MAVCPQFGDFYIFYDFFPPLQLFLHRTTLIVDLMHCLYTLTITSLPDAAVCCPNAP